MKAGKTSENYEVIYAAFEKAIGMAGPVTAF
jgi:hypothetical protein